MKAVCPHCQASITISASPAAAKPVATSADSAVSSAARASAETTNATKATSTSAAVKVVEGNESKVSGVGTSPSAPTPSSQLADRPPATASSEHPAAPRNGSTIPTSANAEPKPTEAMNAPGDVSNITAGPKSRGPAVLAAVVLLLIAGGIAAIWRPWAPSPVQTVVTSPSKSALPSNEGPANPEAASSVVSARPIASTPSIEPPRNAKTPPDVPVTPKSTPSARKPTPDVSRPAPSVPAMKPSPTVPPIPTAQRLPQSAVPQASKPAAIRKPAPPPIYDRSPLNPGTEGTQPVAPKQSLKAGDHLHAQYEGRWYSVTVVETLDDGNVRVRWDTWGRDIVGNVPRSRLRLPTKK